MIDMRRELTETEKLDIAAKAQVAQSYILRIGLLMGFFSLFTIFLAFVSRTPGIESLSVRAFALFISITTLLVWRRSPFSLHAVALVLLCLGVSMFFFSSRPHSFIDWAWRLAYLVAMSTIALQYWRRGTALVISHRKGWERERQLVRQWLDALMNNQCKDSVLVFSTGTFWTGYFTYRLLKADEIWAVAKFKKGTWPLLEYRIYDLTRVQITELPNRSRNIIIAGRSFPQAQFS